MLACFIVLIYYSDFPTTAIKMRITFIVPSLPELLAVDFSNDMKFVTLESQL